MPVTILAGLVLIVVALVLYSIGVWGMFRRKAAGKRDMTFLWAGFACDFLATLMMAIQGTASVQSNLAADPGHYIVTLALGTTTLVLLNDLKTYVALLAMVLMLVVAIKTTLVVRSSDEAGAKSLAKIILAPWALWVLVFVYGLIANAPKR